MILLEVGLFSLPNFDYACFSAVAASKSEDIKSLKNKQKQLKNQISKTDKKLSDTRKNTKQLLQDLEKLNVDIEQRDVEINQRSKEIETFQSQIDSLNNSVKQLSKQYDEMRKKYADMVYYAYITKNRQDKYLFLLSSKSFQEGYRRFQYLSDLAEMRKQQSISLQKTKSDIQLRRDEIKSIKSKTESLLKQQEQEKSYAVRQKQQKSSLVESLRLHEKELKAELRNQQISADNLNQKIQDIIAKQAAAAAERQRKLAAKKSANAKKSTNSSKSTTTQTTTTKNANGTKSNAATTSSYAMTSEEKVIAGGFAKNKGLLMWPVKGTIVGKFGKQPHPVLKDVTINNKGIYISAAPGSKATAVYDGTVSQCFSVPGGNNAVIVRHGNYLTVYANLTELYVKNGQNIKRGTPIGKIYRETDNRNKTTLFFQVWQEKTLLNPQVWLHK